MPTLTAELRLTFDADTGRLTDDSRPGVLSIPQGLVYTVYMRIKSGGAYVTEDPGWGTINWKWLAPGATLILANISAWAWDSDEQAYAASLDTTAHVSSNMLGVVGRPTLLARLDHDAGFGLDEGYTEHVRFRDASRNPKTLGDEVTSIAKKLRPKWSQIDGAPDVSAMVNHGIAAGVYTGIKFSSVAVLEAFDATDLNHGDIVSLQGYYGIGTEGGGDLWLDKSVALGAGARNGGTVLTAAGGSNWYWRRVGEEKNVREFGAKGDGSTDDYIAIQATISAMVDGDDLIIPKGTYSVSDEVTFSTLRNINVYCQGTIKRADGSDSDDLVAVINCHNCTFHNLIVDGNRAGAVDIEVSGEQPNVILGAGCTNIRFLGGELNNAINCGVVLNGQCQNILFDSVTLDNVGEHGFYVSGGENKNCTWRNVRIHDVGQNNGSHMTNHDSHGWKCRTTSASGFSNNENLLWENCVLDFGTNPKGVVTCGWNLFSCKGGLIKNCHLDRATAATGSPLLITGDNSAQEVSDLVVDAFTSLRGGVKNINLIYNSGNNITVGHITVRNCTFGNGDGMYFNRFNLVSRFENCVFNNCRLETDDISGYASTTSKTRFKDCDILGNQTSYYINVRNLTQELIFENCTIDGAGAGIDVIRLAPGFVGVAKPIRFINCNLNQGSANRLINTPGPVVGLVEFIGGYVNGIINGAFIHQGSYDASTNTPDLSVQKTFGYYWIVTTAGTQTLFNTDETTFAIGDLVVSLGSAGFTKYATGSYGAPNPRLVMRDMQTGSAFAVTGGDFFRTKKVNGVWGAVESELDVTFTWNPNSIPDGASETKSDISVPGAAVGDAVTVYPPIDLQGMTYNSGISAADTVWIKLSNNTGGAIDLASSGFWRVVVTRNPRNISSW